MRRAVFAFVSIAGVAVACATARPTEPPEPVTGRWGGTHVGLELTAEGGVLEYDCAAGTIVGALRPDREGRFEASGFHTPATGGPEREGHVRPRFTALYSGTIRDDRMSLRVRIPATSIDIGPLTLHRDAEPVIFRCL